MSLSDKVKKSKKIIREAIKRSPKENIMIAWTGGKDSTVLLHLVREVFDNQIPVKVFFNDSGYEFPEVKKFIKEISRLWSLSLISFKHSSEFMKKINKKPKSLLFREAKIDSIKRAIKKYQTQVFLVGIRKDEHKSRSNEEYRSNREDHIRIHPILDFTERDIWEYIRKYKVPYVSLYDKGYRSLGEYLFTKVVKKGGNERSGRDSEKENLMERLRSLGYW